MPAEQTRRDQSNENIPPPTGTIFVMSAYLLLLVLVWSAMFWLLVEK